MCYSDDARPPLPPISGAAADSGDFRLTSADGTSFAAHFARASKPSGAGMVVLPDVRGLHHFYKELADRFAEAGIDAVAIDYFARSTTDDVRDEAFEYRPHIEATTPETVDADIRAGVEWLRSKDGGAVRSVFTVGFCWGGSTSWRQSATQPGLAGVIGFYGVPSRAEAWIKDFKAPILVFIAGQDFTPVEASQEFVRQAAERVPVESQVYEGAPHSFFDRTFKEHAEASADAWRRILDFVEKNSR